MIMTTPNKETQKAKEEKSDARQEMINKNPCSLCRNRGLPVCKCKGVEAGGGSSDKSEELELSSEPSLDDELFGLSPEAVLDEKLFMINQSQFDLLRLTDLVTITNNASRGILTMRPKLGLNLEDSKAVQEFVHKIKLAFDQFKIALQKQGINVDHFTMVDKPNELTLRIPGPKYYDLFIQQLKANNMLPKESVQEPALTPMGTIPSPLNTKANAKVADNDSEREEPFNPTPFKTTFRPRLEPTKS